jgi:hypothetical protein
MVSPHTPTNQGRRAASNIRDVAIEATNLGLSVFPPREDGTKSPDGSWKENQSVGASLDQIRRWYGTTGPPRRTGIGIICGAVSGNVEAFEFDALGRLYAPFLEAAKAVGLGGLVERISAGYEEQTPSGGVHWLYRCAAIAGNTPLARYLSDELNAKGEPIPKALIETRGEGGYVVTAPSNGRVHPTGRPYVLRRGGLATIATITPEERKALWDLARSFDEMPPDADPVETEVRRVERKESGGWDDTISVIDDYNAKKKCADLLPAGWTHVYTRGETEYWRRPGKTKWVSATINHNGSGRLHVFTTSTEFAPGSYTPFAIFARLNHGNDFKAAWKALCEEGYGTFKAWVWEEATSTWELKVRPNPCPSGGEVRIATPGEGPPPPFGTKLQSGGKAHAEPGDQGGERPWPALRLGKLPDVTAFPLEVLPDAVARIAEEAARAVGCDPGISGGHALAIGGGLIGRSVALRLKPNWFASSCIYHASVALPGDGKSPALEYVMAPAVAIEKGLDAVFQTAKATYEEQCKADPKRKPKPPVPGRLMIDDATMEGYFRVAWRNSRGLLMCNDELTQLVCGLNQYKGGVGNDLATFLKVWAGASVIIDRALNELGEPIRVPHPCLSIAGNLPPSDLHFMVGRNRNGHGEFPLVDRWLYEYPDILPKPAWDERRPVTDDAIEGWARVCKTLWGRLMSTDAERRDCPHIIRFSKPGLLEFKRLYNEHVAEVNSAEFPLVLRGPWAKLEVYAGRLANVLTMLWHAADPTAAPAVLPLVRGERVRGAWKLIEHYKSHHRRVRAALEGSGLAGTPHGARLVLNWIRNHSEEDTLPESELTRTYPPFRDDKAALEDALGWLEERNAVRRARREAPAGKPGRKPAPVWEIHPDMRYTDNPDNPENAAPFDHFPDSPDCPDGPYDDYEDAERRAIQEFEG